MKKTEKGYTNVRNYDTYASYNADTERNDATISFIEQDNSIVVRGKRYSQNAECYVGSNTSGISTTGNWFLAGEATITNARNVNVVGIVQHAITSGTCGIFALGLRGYSESASKFNFSWICKTSGTVPLLRVVINGHTVKLYCKVYGGQYQYAHIRLLDQCNQYESENYKTSFFTLKDSTTIIPEADVPSGTDIADVPYLSKGENATSATNADVANVANKTKYPIVFKRNGASITNWFANTTFAIDIPEELLDYSSPTGITLKVPDEAKKVANDLEIRVNGKQKATFDGSSAKTVNIEASRSHFVKASMYGERWTSPPAGATTPGIPLILDTSYMIPFGRLQDGDTIIMQVPNTLTSTLGYPVYLRLDTTQGNVAGNLVKIIKGQNAGTPVEWEGTTALTAGYYHFVYSEGAGGLIFMYRNVSTS